jgi:hypothetical protein
MVPRHTAFQRVVDQCKIYINGISRSNRVHDQYSYNTILHMQTELNLNSTESFKRFHRQLPSLLQGPSTPTRSVNSTSTTPPVLDTAKTWWLSTKGNLGVGVAHPTSRFEVAGADGLQEYPPKAMTGYETYIEGHGVFRASASTCSFILHSRMVRFHYNTSARRMVIKFGLMVDESYWRYCYDGT